MSEDNLQSQAYLWFHNTYPEFRGLLCYNLNNSRNRVRAMMDKSMGLQPGRSDMVFYYHGRAHMIEFKTDTGVQSKVQKEWQLKVQSHGFSYEIVRNLESFQELIGKIVLMY